MSFSQSLLPEYDNEMATTRRVLERLPEDRMEWLPHAKSMPLGRLATHLAELPGWGSVTLREDSFDISPPGGSGYVPATLNTRAEILELFDKNVASTRAIIESTDDEKFLQPWTFLKEGQQIFTLPRIAVLRTMLLNHVIHHRGQFSVYLRLNDVPVPSIYGPTADEGF